MTRWNVEKRSAFKKQYRNIGRERQKRADVAISELLSSSDPAALGTYKRDGRFFAYNLSKGDRLIYTINYSDRTVTFQRICDHKSAYGMD